LDARGYHGPKRIRELRGSASLRGRRNGKNHEVLGVELEKEQAKSASDVEETGGGDCRTV